MENSLYAFAYTPQLAIIRPYLPLYTCTRGSITHQTNDRLLDFERREFISLPLPSFPLGLDRNFESFRSNEDFDKDSIVDRETCFEEEFSNEARKKVSIDSGKFILLRIKFDETLSKFSSERDAIKNFVNSSIVTNWTNLIYPRYLSIHKFKTSSIKLSAIKVKSSTCKK